MRRILVGNIAVESACIVLADPSVLGQFDSKSGNLDDLLPDGCNDLNAMRAFPAPELPFSREACWVAKASQDRVGILGARHGEGDEQFGDGLVVSTGHGDGLYPVFALVTDTGVVAAVLVEFGVPLDDVEAEPAPEPRRS
jgi:hypothetical protein